MARSESKGEAERESVNPDCTSFLFLFFWHLMKSLVIQAEARAVSAITLPQGSQALS